MKHTRQGYIETRQKAFFKFSTLGGFFHINMAIGIFSL
jgi:hypothetical protein